MLEWKQEFELGIPEIDAQHKHLVEIGGNIYALISDKTRDDYYDEIFMMLKELESYTVEHFSYEESRFDAVNYIDSDAHKFEHKLFVKKLEKYMDNLEAIDADQQGTLLELLDFVTNWLIKHINVTDRQYVDVVNQ